MGGFTVLISPRGRLVNWAKGHEIDTIKMYSYVWAIIFACVNGPFLLNLVWACLTEAGLKGETL